MIHAAQLSHADAARLNHYCSRCRLICYDARPVVQTCKTCRETTGYACCVPADGRPCIDCQRRPWLEV
jgi:hypothetical protein